MTTPREEGFGMPAEWGPHQATLMAWSTRTRDASRGPVFELTKKDYAAITRATTAFEPVIMVCTPGEAHEVLDRCGAGHHADGGRAAGRGRPGSRSRGYSGPGGGLRAGSLAWDEGGWKR
jgi:Porphyromonas-type peptidyl-arginine deiminase